MKQRLLFILLMAFCASQIVTAKKHYWSGLSWEYKDGVLTIEGKGPMANCSYQYGGPWRKYRREINEVIIKDGVTSIGDFAFYDIKNKYAIKTVVIPNSVVSIGHAAFAGLESLTGINIPSSVTNIGRGVFEDCYALTHIIFRPSITTIDKWLFKGCCSLSNITIPSSVTHIGASAFEGCNITEITTSDYDPNINVYMPALPPGAVIIPNSVTSIGDKAFECSYLKYVRIPNSVNSIGKRAFYSGKLLTIWIPNSVNIIDDEAFGDRFRRFDGKLVTIPDKFLEDSYRIGIAESAVKKYKQTARNSNGNPMFMSDYLDGLGYTVRETVKNGNVNYYIVSKDYSKYGLIDASGKTVIPVELESLASAGSGFFKFKNNGYWGIMDYRGQTIIPTSRGYTSIGNYIVSQRTFAYTMNGYRGECNSQGIPISKIKVTPPRQETTSSSSTSNSRNNSSSQNNNNNSSRSQTQTVVIQQQPVPVQEWQQCAACYGSGQCPNYSCGGRGWFYLGDRITTCSRCWGSGKCTMCAGRGGQYITVYR